MAKLKHLEDYRQEIEQCVKCGGCRAHCPVFGAEKLEGCVARGKISLADARLKGDVELEEKFLLDMSQCLLCGSCYSQCPNGIHTEDIVAASRREIAHCKGLSMVGKGITTVLKNQGLMSLMAKGGGAFSKLLFKNIPRQSGLRLRFPAPFISPNRTLPQPALKPFRERHPERIPGTAGQPTILFFTGCGINYLYPDSGDALLGALNYMGATVLIPKEQACCGFPAISAGDGATVESFAEQNLRMFRKYKFDYIVTACASCYSALKRLYPGMGREFDICREKTKDIFEFLEEHGFAEKLGSLPRTRNRKRVTYHDPCHLRNHGITRQPRNILRALPHIDYIEMEDAGTCCGLGGTYSVYHYETSKKIGAGKAKRIAQSNADIVSTNCPGCILQLQDSLNHTGKQVRAVHVLDLIAEALIHPDKR